MTVIAVIMMTYRLVAATIASSIRMYRDRPCSPTASTSVPPQRRATGLLEAVEHRGRSLRLPCTYSGCKGDQRRLSGSGAGGKCRQRAVCACMCRVTKLADSSTACSRRACLHLSSRFVSRLATIQLPLLSYRHADQGAASAGDPQGAGAGAVLATAAASRIGWGNTGGAYADAGLQPAA